jgi:hypothetical protein
VFYRTSTSLLITYVVMILLFWGPPAVTIFAKAVLPRTTSSASTADSTARPSSLVVEQIHRTGVTSPFAAAFAVPSVPGQKAKELRPRPIPESWQMWAAHLAWSTSFNLLLLAGMIWLFRTRWRVSQ